MKESIFKMIDDAFGGWEVTLREVVKIVSQTPQNFNPTVYAAIQDVYQGLLPIAYNLLALFFLIEFLSKSSTLEVMKWEQVAKILFKMVLAKVIIESTFAILGLIFLISSSAIARANSALNIASGISDVTQQIKASVPNDTLGQIAYLVSFFPYGFFLFITRLIVFVIAYGRMIEIYLLTAVASLPISTFTSSGLQNIGKKFFLNYAGLCLQGLFIFLITKLYGAITVGVAASNGGIDLVGKMLLTSIITITLLVKSGSWAKQLTGTA